MPSNFISVFFGSLILWQHILLYSSIILLLPSMSSILHTLAAAAGRTFAIWGDDLQVIYGRLGHCALVMISHLGSKIVYANTCQYHGRIYSLNIHSYVIDKYEIVFMEEHTILLRFSNLKHMSLSCISCTCHAYQCNVIKGSPWMSMFYHIMIYDILDSGLTCIANLQQCYCTYTITI